MSALRESLATFYRESESRLTKIRTIQVSTFAYDGDGLMRNLRESGGNPHTLVWDGDAILMDTYSGNTYRYNVVNGEVISEDINGTHYLYTPDPLGSMVALIDGSQSIIASYDYWPFGVVRVQTGSAGHNPFQFVGAFQYYQHAASAADVRKRVLRVDLGRWQTEDPIGFAGGDFNLYGYVGGAPTVGVDPSGLSPTLLRSCGCESEQEVVLGLLCGHLESKDPCRDIWNKLIDELKRIGGTPGPHDRYCKAIADAVKSLCAKQCLERICTLSKRTCCSILEELQTNKCSSHLPGLDSKCHKQIANGSAGCVEKPPLPPKDGKI